MDINEALVRLRAAVRNWDTAVEDLTVPVVEAGNEMRDAILDIDEWLSAGGFLPTDWQRNRPA